MRVNIYSPVYFESWSWRNSVEGGIGGSETTHTELAWRLAQRGHEVTSYAPLPKDCAREWRGTSWRDLSEADFSQPGIWLVFRNAECMDHMPGPPEQRIWLCCQDEVPLGITAERIAKIERIVAYCPWHKEHMERHLPEVCGRVCISTNGIKLDLIREVEATGIPQRNPRRLMFASSPDRGLLNVLKIFRRAREYVPDLELHCFYGCDNIEKLIEFSPRFKYFKGFLEKLKCALDQPGVIWHGRTSQPDLYLEWLKTGIFCSCTNFEETSGISALEAMALGAIPLVIPRGAFLDNIRHGVFIQGDEGDQLTQARMTDALIHMAEDAEAQERMRTGMMQYARQRFSWERVCDQIEAWMLNVEQSSHHHQFAFQRKHVTGKIINIGANCDGGALREEFGAFNVDITAADPFTGIENKVDLLCDARKLSLELNAIFDSAVCGDVLEHMNDADQLATLQNTRRVLKSDGRLIITCPDDDRPACNQHHGADGSEEYLPGVCATHWRKISREHLENLCRVAGFEPVAYQPLDYGDFIGHGIVAEVAAIPAEAETREELTVCS